MKPWVWFKLNAQPLYYTLGAIVFLVTLWGIYKTDSNEKQAHTEALQDSTNRLIRQEPHKLRDSLRADISNAIQPLNYGMDSLKRVSNETNTQLRVLSGKVEVLTQLRREYGSSQTLDWKNK